MSIWKLRLGLNPFTLLLSVLVGLCLVCSYFYLLSFLLGAASPDQGPGADTRRRHLLLGEAFISACDCVWGAYDCPRFVDHSLALEQSCPQNKQLPRQTIDRTHTMHTFSNAHMFYFAVIHCM